MDNTAIISDPGSNHYPPGHSKPYDPRQAADAQESMKAKLNAIRKKLVEQVSRRPCITHCVYLFYYSHQKKYVLKSFLVSILIRSCEPQGGARFLFILIVSV